MYIAVTYIGGSYVPGEVISEDTPKEILDWLIQAGAVRSAAPAHFAPDGVEGNTTPDVMRQNIEEEAPVEVLRDSDGSDDDYDIDEEAAPEIDVMAGIVKEEKPAPAKKPRATGKRTPKGGKTK